ncbi:unnamed protein product [Prunus brigantina]
MYICNCRQYILPSLICPVLEHIFEMQILHLKLHPSSQLGNLCGNVK